MVSKFTLWARKIVEEVSIMEYNDRPEDDIIEYLEKCADDREVYLDPNDLTDTERYWTLKSNERGGIWETYGVIDPIWEDLKEDLENEKDEDREE